MNALTGKLTIILFILPLYPMWWLVMWCAARQAKGSWPHAREIAPVLWVAIRETWRGDW